MLFAQRRPEEELYDLRVDPHEIHNLAEEPAHQATLLELRKRLDRWMIETNDQGRRPESLARYDSDMQVYLDSKNTELNAILQQNIAQMKQWAAEGK
jgi:hypothetical protein